MGFKRLEDDNGNKSSKRLSAAVCLILGVVIIVVSFTRALFHPLGDSKFILDLLYTLFGSMTVLGVSTVFEPAKRFLKRKKSK